MEWRKITIVGFKGSTHSISYNVRTTTCTVLACAAQADTTPMQKPDSVTGQARLSSKVLTAHNILLPAGVISRCTAVIVPIVRFRQERISFYPKIAIISCFRTAVLPRTKSNTDEFGELRSELRISSYFLSCLGVRVLGSKPNQSSRPGNSNTDSSHHVVLQAFVYKTAIPREATNILEYQNITSTHK